MFGRTLVLLGIALVVVGLIAMGIERYTGSQGRLPGDIVLRGERWRVYFPIVTSIVISLALTLVLNLIAWFFRRG